MKVFRAFFRSLRDAFKSVFRNFSLSLASISCIVVTLIIISCAILLSLNVRNFTKEIESDVTIVAFLNYDVKEEDRKQFEAELKKIDNVDSYTFKSKQAVTDEMIDNYDTFSEILKDWDDDENPLKDTYTIKVKDVENIGKTAKIIQELENVNTVQYGEGLVEQLISMFGSIQKFTIIAAVSLILVTIFLIVNTIKLTIFSRKREISIMRLVGASNIRIKLPFVFEGIMLGIIGSIIPMLLTYFGYKSLFDHLGGKVFSPIIKLVEPVPYALYTCGILLLIGTVVGMIGSARAVRRYVKI